jgi:hypothetical protein
MPSSKYEPRDVRRGDEILASEFNRLRREVARLGRMRGAGGVEVRQGPGGPTMIGKADDDLIRAKVTGGDIDAFEDTGADEPGVGECTVYEWKPSTLKRTLGDETHTVYNDYPAVIPDGTDVWLAFWENAYWIAIINCPTPP